MLQQCSHPNVVRYLGSYQGEEYLWVWRVITSLDFKTKSCSWLICSNVYVSISVSSLSLCLHPILEFFSLFSLWGKYFFLADSNGVLWGWKCCWLNECHRWGFRGVSNSFYLSRGIEGMLDIKHCFTVCLYDTFDTRSCTWRLVLLSKNSVLLHSILIWRVHESYLRWFIESPT